MIDGASNLVPAPSKGTPLAGAYIDFQTATWAQQYLPDLIESEAEVFGNRTISGFLSQVGAEEAMSADQVVWSEQGRLHLSYEATAGASGVMTVTKDADGKDQTLSGHGVRVGDMVLLATSSDVIALQLELKLTLLTILLLYLLTIVQLLFRLVVLLKL
jgi:hypothetical protein